MWYPFVQTNLELYAPRRPGVYAIAQGGMTLYVGQAINLRDRLSEHLNERDNLALGLALLSGNAIFMVAERPASMLDQTEGHWIVALRPTCNRRSPTAGI